MLIYKSLKYLFTLQWISLVKKKNTPENWIVAIVARQLKHTELSIIFTFNTMYIDISVLLVISSQSTRFLLILNLFRC